jgi:hypothetical protein
MRWYSQEIFFGNTEVPELPKGVRLKLIQGEETIKIGHKEINRMAAGDYGYTAAIHAKEGNVERARELATRAANLAHRAGHGKPKRRRSGPA